MAPATQQPQAKVGLTTGETYQTDNAVKIIQVVGDVLLLQEVGRSLEDVCCVAGVVVAVGTVVVGFYQGQPVLHDVILDLQSLIDLESQQGGHSKPDKWPKNR